MSRLEEHQQALYELRFSPMTKPAGEVAGLTQLETHTTRARTMIFWRIAAGLLAWGSREVEILYESTLDNISEAFDVFSYPIDRYMLDARADVWDAGLAPEQIQQVVADSAAQADAVSAAPSNLGERPLLLGGELAQLGDASERLRSTLESALDVAGVDAAIWIAPTGAVPYVLGAREEASRQAQAVADAAEASDAQTIIADGPETAWMLRHVYPELEISLPDGVDVRLLSEVLAEEAEPPQNPARVFVHDSRPAYELATAEVSNRAIMPGYQENEDDFGQGPVYEAPRRLLDAMGAERIFGSWTRGLARTSGADDALWLTYPELAAGLARQRLDYARQQGADLIVADSPLAAVYLSSQRDEDDLPVRWLPELLVETT